MNIFVGNLLFEATEADVLGLFQGFGEVSSVAIVMEKKGLKSRGFGFVEMPNDEEAKSAIAALNEKDFMGRVLNVSPSIPKTSAEKDAEKKKKKSAKVIDINSERPQKSVPREDSAFRQFFPKPGSFKGGRRTRSYFKKQEAAGIVVEPGIFRKKPKDNPMRWLKRRDQPRLWSKPEGDVKPWAKSTGESRPWKKTEGEARPWKKTEGEAKPWQKSRGGAKPWEKRTGDSRPPWKKPEGEARPWKKTEGEAKPWQKSRTGPKPWVKSTSESRPWKKPEGEAKPWRKSSERPQQSRFKARKKPGAFKK